MKTKLLLISIVTVNLFSQWQGDVRLTNNPYDLGTSYNNAWCIAAEGNFVHTVWFDYFNNIYYKASTNKGATWGTETQIENSSSNYPSICVSGFVVHIVWRENMGIYYKRSTDNGANWETTKRLTNNLSDSRNPSVAVFGQVVHIVWWDIRDGNGEIYFKNSSDAGESWSSDTRLTNQPADSRVPSIAVNDLNVHVVWRDERDGNAEEYYKFSTNGGINWSGDIRLTNDPGYSGYPSISVAGNFVHVTWNDTRDGNYEIYYKHSLNGGISWGADTRLTNTTQASMWPSVKAMGSAVHTVWQDHRHGTYPYNGEIYYKLSTDGGISWTDDTRLTNDTFSSNGPSVAICNSIVNVLWMDNRDGNYEIYYKRNPTGNPIGINNINTEIPHQYNLTQNYPNPFNPTTNFEFSIPQAEFVNLTIYDAMGRVVETLQNGELKSGIYKADWNASNHPSGVYFYKLNAGSFNDTKKMVLLK